MWMGYGRINIFCSEIPFGVNLYRKETSQFICVPNQLPGFCIVRSLLKGITEETLIDTICNYMTK